MDYLLWRRLRHAAAAVLAALTFDRTDVTFDNTTFTFESTNG